MALLKTCIRSDHEASRRYYTKDRVIITTPINDEVYTVKNSVLRFDIKWCIWESKTIWTKLIQAIANRPKDKILL